MQVVVDLQKVVQVDSCDSDVVGVFGQVYFQCGDCVWVVVQFSKVIVMDFDSLNCGKWDSLL